MRYPAALPVLPVLAVAAAALLGGPLPAAGQLDVLIVSPPPGQPIFGTAPVVVEVLGGEAVAEVVVALDGEVVARLTEAPYRFEVDFGEHNVSHRLEVTARGVAGASGRALREIPRVDVDDELDLELQQLYVTATRQGARVRDLERHQFRIRDNGVLQDIVTFERGDVPLTAALVVDASASMTGDRLKLAVAGARRFVEGMAELDEASLLLFSDQLLASTPFTDDPQALTAALGGVTASGGTAVNDHLYVALKRLEARQGRRVVILLTDGIDIESTLRMEEVLWVAGRSQALIYWIRLYEEGRGSVARFSSWRSAEGHRREEELLVQAVEDSGGRIVTIGELGQAAGVYQEILAELRDQYVLGYYPKVSLNDGSWHDVEVSPAGVVGVELRARKGYIDF